MVRAPNGFYKIQETLYKVDFQMYNRITLTIGYFVWGLWVRVPPQVPLSPGFSTMASDRIGG